MTIRILAAGLILIALFAACSPSATSTSAVSTPSATLDTQQDQAPSPLEDAVRAGSARPTWQTMPLVNAETGATFTLAGFPDRTVYIELMATWCTNCRIQQGNVRTVRDQLGEVNYVYVSLSVEPNDTTPMLTDYRVKQNYPWTFAIAPPDMVRALVNQFGQTVTNPTSTPHFVISPAGAISQLSTGIHSTDQLVAELTAAAGA